MAHCSSPGKVLITGAYLVLDELYSGLVVAVDARIHAFVRPLDSQHKQQHILHVKEKDDIIHLIDVNLIAKQMGVVSKYVLLCAHSKTFGVYFCLHPSTHNSHPNPYIESSLLFCCSVAYALLYEKSKHSFEEKPTHEFELQILNEIVMRFTSNHTTNGIEIEISADNHFYSQHDNLNLHSLPKSSHSFTLLPKFLPATRGSDGNLQKTGLGSSAALTVATVASLFSFLNLNLTKLLPLNSPTEKKEEISHKEIIHRLSQLIHCYSQGKIGSGFDIKCAVFGSHLYRRFPSHLLSQIISQTSSTYTFDSHRQLATSRWVLPSPFNILRSLGYPSSSLLTTSHSPQQKQFCVACEITSSTENPLHLTISHQAEPCEELTLSQWACHTEQFHPPPGITMLLADIRGGSNTPSMVRKVMSWCQSFPFESNNLWKELNITNYSVFCGMKKLSQLSLLHQHFYFSSLSSWCNPTQPDGPNRNQNDNEIHNTLNFIQSQFQIIRSLLRKMGNESDVPIEPPSQTALLNATMQLSGVLFAGVPGAGGYDSLFVLVRSKEEDVRKVEELWVTWGECVVLPVEVHFDSMGLIDYEQKI
jgi:phosphomevalonate kinase